MIHTPGPWGARLIEGKYRLYPRSERLGMTFAVIDDNEANALLIAAAPDLLAACKTVSDAAFHISEWDGDDGGVIIEVKMSMRSLHALRQAIAKATGGAQ